VVICRSLHQAHAGLLRRAFSLSRRRNRQIDAKVQAILAVTAAVQIDLDDVR
jgi:hypothetical protein